MKKNMRLLLIITCCLLVLSGCGKSKEDNNIDINDMPDIKGDENVKEDKDGIKTNTSDALTKDKVFDRYKVTDSKLVTKEDKTFLTTTIKNISSSKAPGALYDIIFINKNEQQLSKMGLYIRDLEAGEVMSTTVSIDKDMANAYDFILKKK